jgi:ornithine cyclodeaminase
VLIIRHGEVAEILAGRELEVIDVVRSAYRRHAEGRTVVPHSVFLRFPDQPRNRIIGLPAYLNDGSEPASGTPSPGTAAGMKWIASWPGNIESNLPRASATIIMNSLRTGQPEAVIEGSLISARRTAASAALGASLLLGDRSPDGITLVGCGLINLEVLRFVAAQFPNLARVSLFDIDPERAASFAQRCVQVVPHADVTVSAQLHGALAAHSLISVATTAAQPYTDLADCKPGSVVLHLSLRDVTAEAVVRAHNVVDDADHVCRERTSLELAEQAVGDRRFIDAEIGHLIIGDRLWQPDPGKLVLYSPFGLGVLDIAVAQMVLSIAREEGRGIDIPDFVPAPA